MCCDGCEGRTQRLMLTFMSRCACWKENDCCIYPETGIAAALSLLELHKQVCEHAQLRSCNTHIELYVWQSRTSVDCDHWNTKAIDEFKFTHRREVVGSQKLGQCRVQVQIKDRSVRL